LEEKWQEVVDVVPKERITAVTISETVDNNPELRLKQIRIKIDTYDILAKKAAAAGMSISELLARLVDEYNPRNLEQPAEHTPEQEEILDQLDEEFKKPATEQASSSAKGNKSKGFGVQVKPKSSQVKVKPKSSQGEVKPKSSQGEVKPKSRQTEIPVGKQSNSWDEKSYEIISSKSNTGPNQLPGSSLTRDSLPPN